MEVTWKRWEVFKAEEALKSLAVRKLRGKVSYWLNKINRVVVQEARDLRSIKDLRKDDRPDWNKRLAQYQRRMTIISQECAMISDRGSPVIRKDGSYSIDDMGKYDVMMTELDGEFEDVAEARFKAEMEFDRAMEEDITLDLHSLRFELLPEEFMPGDLGPLVEAIIEVPTDEEVIQQEATAATLVLTKACEEADREKTAPLEPVKEVAEKG